MSRDAVMSTGGFSPVYDLPRSVEQPVPVLALVRFQRTTVNRHGEFVDEEVTYRDAWGHYLGGNEWSLEGKSGEKWMHTVEEDVYTNAVGGSTFIDFSEVVACMPLPEGLLDEAAETVRVTSIAHAAHALASVG